MDESHNGPHAGKGGFSTRSQEYAMSRSFVDPLPLKIYPHLLVPLIISLTIFILCLTSIHMLKNATAMFCCPSPSKYKPRLSPSFLITISLLSFHVSCVASEDNEANSIRRTWIPSLALFLSPPANIVSLDFLSVTNNPSFSRHWTWTWTRYTYRSIHNRHHRMVGSASLSPESEG